jgi:hypothetical protein
MRSVTAVVLLALSAPASADHECNVRVVRAPDQVRAAIEARIGIETSCITLEVRVISTRDGYYVIATPPHGDVLEGTVRDPSLVGELVADWAHQPEPAAPPPTVAEQPPSATPMFDVVEQAPAQHRRGTRDFTMGVLFTPKSYGVRGEVDLIAASGFSLGLAAGISSAHWIYGDDQMFTLGADLVFRDIRGVVTVAKTFGTGAWRVRLQAGLGVVNTTYSGTMRADNGLVVPTTGEGTTRMVEVGLTASRDLSATWAFSFGPMLTYYGQTYDLDESFESFTTSRDYDVGAFASIRRHL